MSAVLSSLLRVAGGVLSEEGALGRCPRHWLVLHRYLRAALPFGLWGLLS